MPHPDRDLDPRTGLPRYIRDGRSAAHDVKLERAAADYSDTAGLLEGLLTDVGDEFASAFERDDARRATHDRLSATAKAHRAAARR